MSRIQLVIICLVTLTLPVPAGDPAQKAAVKKLAKELGDATLKGDHAKVIDYTYEGIVKKLGGRAKAIETTDQIMKMLRGQGITFKSFEPGTPGEFHNEGGMTFVIVPTVVEMTLPMGRMIAKSYLLGISSDGGKTWTFADGAGLANKEQRDQVLPKLPAKLKLPEKQQPQIIRD
jgi:hypothetical protein